MATRFAPGVLAREKARRQEKTQIARDIRHMPLTLQREKEAARTARISQFQSFMSPIVSRFATPQVGVTGTPGEPSAAQQALEATILRRGEEAQGTLSSQLAQRGIYGGGPSAAAATKLQADIESNVALSSAQFEEQEAQRRTQERIARRQAFSSLMGNITSQLGAM